MTVIQTTRELNGAAAVEPSAPLCPPFLLLSEPNVFARRFFTKFVPEVTHQLSNSAIALFSPVQFNHRSVFCHNIKYLSHVLIHSEELLGCQALADVCKHTHSLCESLRHSEVKTSWVSYV